MKLHGDRQIKKSNKRKYIKNEQVHTNTSAGYMPRDAHKLYKIMEDWCWIKSRFSQNETQEIKK
jgi:hypothetical protein